MGVFTAFFCFYLISKLLWQLNAMTVAHNRERGALIIFTPRSRQDYGLASFLTSSLPTNTAYHGNYMLRPLPGSWMTQSQFKGARVECDIVANLLRAHRSLSASRYIDRARFSSCKRDETL